MTKREGDHTPQKLKWIEGTPDISVEWNGGDALIARTFIPRWHENKIKGSEEAGANAQFIVTACNQHYKLKEDNEVLIEVCKTVQRAYTINDNGLSMAKAMDKVNVVIENAIK